MKYDVIRYRKRGDGRIEPSGKKPERMELTSKQAEELSYLAIVVSTTPSPSGRLNAIIDGRHAQFDPHLGWIS